MPTAGFRLSALITRHAPGCALAAFCLGLAILPVAAADRAPPTAPTASVALQPAAAADVTEAATPNCLLPGQIRSVGGIALVTPRRPVTLASADCAARGGEPIASD
jgi:uncharacterized protein